MRASIIGPWRRRVSIGSPIAVSRTSAVKPGKTGYECDRLPLKRRRRCRSTHVMITSLGSARECTERPMIRGLIFASCYVYSPLGSNDASERSRLLRTLLKASDATFIFKYAGRVRQQVCDSSPLTGFFCPENVLVPVPGSTPRVARGGTAAELLAKALLEVGLGRSVWTGLRRVRPVLKSATATPGSRPTVAAHYESFAVGPAESCPREVMLVDDVVTKGRTLLAAAARLQEVFPHAQIRAFALVRTMGFIPDVHRLLDPCVGEIRWKYGDAVRTP
jgi:hypothetical protein